MGEPTYYNQGRQVCKRGQVPINIAVCENTTTAKAIVAALNFNSDLLAALKGLYDIDWSRSQIRRYAMRREAARLAIAKAEKHSKEDGT